MSKVKTFDYNSFSDIQTDLVIKLKEIAKEHGISLRILKARYKQYQGTFFIQASITGSDGKVKTQEEQDWNKYAEQWGLKKEWLGQSFVVNLSGKRYTIIGLLPNRRKYPVLTVTDRGRRIIHPISTVQGYMNGMKDHNEEESDE